MKKFFVAVAWSASLAVAFVGGKVASTSAESEPVASLPERQPVAERAVAAKPVASRTDQAAMASAPEVMAAGSKPQPVAIPAVELVETKPASFSQRLDAVMADDHPIRRAAGFNELLLDLTPERAELMFERLRQSPQTRSRDREMRMLAFAWGEVDGPSALARLREVDDENGRDRWRRQESLVDSALAGWASKDAVAAEKWARQQSDEEDNPFLVGVVRGVSLSDPDRAAEILYTLPFGRNRGHAAAYLVDSFFKDGSESVRARIEALPADALKDGMVRMAVGRMASEDPAATGAWLANLSDVDIEHSAEMLGAVWTRRDPDAALDWVSRLNATEARAESMESVVRHWPNERLAELETVLMEMADPVVRDEAVAALVGRGEYRGKEEATEKWLALIDSEEKRTRTRERLQRDAERRNRWRDRRTQ